MARAVLVVLASFLMLTACGQLESLLQGEEQRKPSREQAGKRDSSPTTANSEAKGVGDTAEVGSFLVTLNDAKAHSFDAQGDGANNHYYAVADLTLENSAEAPVDAAKAEFLLRDEEGYSFEKKSITEQKP